MTTTQDRITPAEARRMGFRIESDFNAFTNTTSWRVFVRTTGQEVAYSSRGRKYVLGCLLKKITLGLISLDECWICEKEFFNQGSICCEKCNLNLPPSK